MLADGKKKVHATEFVKRQSKESRFSYPAASWEQVEEWTEKNMMNFTQGYRQGVLIVHLPQEIAREFRCGITKNEDAIRFDSIHEARREGEKPFSTRVAVVKEKPVAEYCDVILYHKDVMAEDPLNDIEELGLWNIVSVNCRLEEKEYPIPPLTMARNYLGEDGGTLGEYTADQFAESIWFWSQHTLCIEEGYWLSMQQVKREEDEEKAFLEAGRALAQRLDDIVFNEIIKSMRSPDPEAEKILEDNWRDLV